MCLLAARAPESEIDAGKRSSFEGIITNDEDTLAQLASLTKGRSRSLLFKQLFDSHGAAQPRSEQQPLCFLGAE